MRIVFFSSILLVNCHFLFSGRSRFPFLESGFLLYPPLPHNLQVAFGFSALGVRLIDVHGAAGGQIQHDLLAASRNSNRLDIPPYALNTLAPATPCQADPAQDLNRFAHDKLQDNPGMGLDLGRGSCQKELCFFGRQLA